MTKKGRKESLFFYKCAEKKWYTAPSVGDAFRGTNLIRSWSPIYDPKLKLVVRVTPTGWWRRGNDKDCDKDRDKDRDKDCGCSRGRQAVDRYGHPSEEGIVRHALPFWVRRAISVAVDTSLRQGFGLARVTLSFCYD